MPTGLLGVVALAFGFAALRMQGGVGVFSVVNIALGSAALAFSGVRALRQMRQRARGSRNPALREALASLALVSVLGVGCVAGTSLAGWRFDWTFEGRYELADATLAALAAAPDLRMTLYVDDLDPRLRRTRLLLEEMSRVAGAELRERRLDDHPDDIDRFGIGASNSVVLERREAAATGPRGRPWALVDQPSEGPLYEALARLSTKRAHRLYLAVGSGEGDIEAVGAQDYSGLAAALETEGYEVIPLPTAFVTRIPQDAEGLLILAPERSWRAEALAALETYLAEGGRVIALLEPGQSSGVEDVLARWGLASPDKLLVDPASGEIDGETPGTAPVAFNYATHPVSHGLDRNRVTFFRGARGFTLRKPEVEDRITGVVMTSGDAWMSDELDLSTRSGRFGAGPAALAPPGVRSDYYPIVAAGEYQRGAYRTRIVAFGDADFASNRYLRALYNLDLMLNAVHWALEREVALTLRPKASNVVQFPLPLQSTLSSFYGVGLLLPEILLMAAGWVWVRGRNA